MSTDTVRVLGSFEGKPVTRSEVIIRRAGVPMRDALAIDPKRWESGEHAFFLIEAVNGSVRFDPVDKADSEASEAYARVHIFDALHMTELPEGDVGHFIYEETARLRKLREDQAGLQQLFDSASDALKDAESDNTEGTDDTPTDQGDNPNP